MAIFDDVKQLAQEDVVYLSKRTVGLPGAPGPLEVFRGRLRYAASGSWIFTTFMGQNGVVGFDLGTVSTDWDSSDYGSGRQIDIRWHIVAPGAYTIDEWVTLSEAAPVEFME